MRKIDILAKDAFYSNQNFKLSNTEVRVTNNVVRMYLHGNLIARKDIFQRVESNTTKSRLRALGADITTKNGKVYANGLEISINQWFNI